MSMQTYQLINANGNIICDINNIFSLFICIHPFYMFMYIFFYYVYIYSQPTRKRVRNALDPPVIDEPPIDDKPVTRSKKQQTAQVITKCIYCF